MIKNANSVNKNIKESKLEPMHKVFAHKLVEVSLRLEQGEGFGKLSTRMLIDVFTFNAVLYYKKDISILSDAIYDRLFKHLQVRYKKGRIKKQDFYYIPNDLFEQATGSFPHVLDFFIIDLATYYSNNQKEVDKIVKRRSNV